MLELLFESFCEHHLGRNTEQDKQFSRFQSDGGESLFLHALYDCIHEYYFTKDPNCWGWPVWPKGLRDPLSLETRQFALDHHRRHLFFVYLQWCAKKQLKSVQAAAERSGMQVGIYLDLAVGVDLNGSEVWSNQSSFAINISAGAPPDEFARAGQDWGFPPMCPKALEFTGFELFRRTLRANMSLCGAVRYDHAASLLRLWWIPQGSTAAEGAYVRYPLESLLGLISLESQQNKCLVIGEDLGTVPDELTQRMESQHVFSYRVLYFEQEALGMVAPDSYPAEAAAAITTHDLPTLVSWWQGSDIDLRDQLGLLGSPEVALQMQQHRHEDKKKILQALRSELLWSKSTDPGEHPKMTHELSVAVHRYLARSHAGVMIVQLEELMEMESPVNVPGTFDNHRNWQRKLHLTIEEVFEQENANNLLLAIRKERQNRNY